MILYCQSWAINLKEWITITNICSFSPIARDDATRLILGSTPGKQSLAKSEYYAHSRNAFWPIMGELLRFSHLISYSERCLSLMENRIALWDVLGACVRKSSLDSDIIESSIVPNDIMSFLVEHKHISRIYFNGLKAEQSFIRYVTPTLQNDVLLIPSARLPSTSPANARMSFEEKLAAWSFIVE